ncbi:CBS domain-containing protein [Streptomyces sp. ICBB 8177]|uniref:CBS domain-containing protein n=1 Tax=Streptomyces sp. ICBB 8177 TaxID=563922 RepID=UPI000D677CFC|nr:CBS domain-containing protein [Streptomyces sp. ICBB 8177]PWI44741.1 inosine-5'-monophosphate dehydrogenase [Streptomyces sp. ICBB 8177]
MRHRCVGDLMTSAVVWVRPDTPFKDVAKLLAEHDITALPVLDEEDRPLGVVSEADLLRWQAGQPDPGGRSSGVERTPRFTASGLMSSPAVVAQAEWSVVEAARAMERHGVKRLPVVDEAGRLVGLLSRSDLVRVFLRRDQAICEEITHDVLDGTLCLAPTDVDVSVVDGRVTLRGTVEHGGTIAVVVRLCRAVDGVIDVQERLQCRTDASPAA